MEILIYNYTGYESEFEVSVNDKGKLRFEYYVTYSDIKLFLDEDGHGRAKIHNIKCVTYDEDGNPSPYNLDDNQIKLLERELTEYVDWEEWKSWKFQPDDDHEERKLRSRG
jgi:hypothetical protein